MELTRTGSFKRLVYPPNSDATRRSWPGPAVAHPPCALCAATAALPAPARSGSHRSGPLLPDRPLLQKQSVIPGRTSAQLPSTSYDPLASSERASSSSSPSPFGSKPASKGVVVFHLGIRFNHPLGPLSPSAKEVADQFQACHGDLLKRAREYGCLGATTWHGDEAARNNTLLIIYYFRDVDGLNRFAHDGIHRHTWGWFNRTVLQKRGHKHIGIFHEAFCAPAVSRMRPRGRRSGCVPWLMRRVPCGGARCRGWGRMNAKGPLS
ncbi:hypothetical protein N657DRAFT_321593 [Parathielavia appendiculata]|uniref:Uncharacterized protein n=1 Tax=Parathielavia appendiculata TaxID=2587402 RepID=A0AAN6TR41_9PEZI|nr:hypothetical protein N657DRAFT_321593 [Parathielavia appendiculata]